MEAGSKPAEPAAVAAAPLDREKPYVEYYEGLAAAFAGAWTGYLAYVAHGHRARWHAQLDVLPQSLVMTSVFTVHYWWLFAVVSILSLLTAGYMARIGHASVVLKVFIAVNALVGAMIINVMVVATSFELSGLLGK